MLKFVVFIPLMCISALTLAQVRVSALVIKKNEIYKLNPSDIIVADTLIMMDSARIVLNPLKPENFIRANVAIIGNNCTIEGKGTNGAKGRNGSAGNSPIG